MYLCKRQLCLIALDESGVDAATIEKEIEIARSFASRRKPEAMLDNIAKGKLARFFKDNTLVKIISKTAN
jgi:elongation factor Ts